MTVAPIDLESKRQKPLLSREDIAKKICQGAILFIYRSQVVNATSWAPYHPGGALALLHFVGRDATDEVEAYHSQHAIQRMLRLVVGRVTVDEKLGWRPLTPPIALGLVRHPDGVPGHWIKEGEVTLGSSILGDARGSQEKTEGVVELSVDQLEPPKTELDLRREKFRSNSYQELRKKIEDAGLFNPPGPLAGYGSDIVRYIALGSTAFYLFFTTTGWLGQMASAIFLGLFYHQLTFLAHDAGHTGVTGDWWWDRVIGMIVADWIGGLSLGWWCDNHNIHHLVTNHPEHDPDIQHIPFFAISKKFFGSLWSTYYKRVMALDAFSKVLIPLQHKLYYIVLSLARFNLYANSYGFLALKAKRNNFWRFEIAGIVFFWAYFGAMLYSEPNWKMRLAYLLIVLSHFACSTDDLGPEESFASRQLRTTMDVVCSPEVEFMHGGLHLQVTHHLFPRLPRHNLRKASLLVKDYCKEQDIVYREHGFIEGNKHVLGVLEDVANQLSFLKTVADAEIDEKLQ